MAVGHFGVLLFNLKFFKKKKKLDVSKLQQCLAFLTHQERVSPGYPVMSEHQTSSLPPAGVSAPPCHHPAVSANTDGDSKDTLSCSVCYRWQNAQSQTSVGIQGTPA